MNILSVSHKRIGSFIGFAWGIYLTGSLTIAAKKVLPTITLKNRKWYITKSNLGRNLIWR